MLHTQPLMLQPGTPHCERRLRSLSPSPVSVRSCVTACHTVEDACACLPQQHQQQPPGRHALGAGVCSRTHMKGVGLHRSGVYHNHTHEVLVRSKHACLLLLLLSPTHTSIPHQPMSALLLTQSTTTHLCTAPLCSQLAHTTPREWPLCRSTCVSFASLQHLAVMLLLLVTTPISTSHQGVDSPSDNSLSYQLSTPCAGMRASSQDSKIRPCWGYCTAE